MIVRSKAPLRLGLAGGGTDVSPYSEMHGGLVLNATIDRYAYCTIEARDGAVEYNAPDVGRRIELPLADALITNATHLPLHHSVYRRVMREFNNGIPLPLRVTTYSDVPAGSGLGSSSTLVVAMVRAFVELLNIPIGDYEIANLAYEIERVDVGLSGGKQDQYAATFGGFNFIEFHTDGMVVVNPLRVKDWVRNELENSILLFFTGTSRSSAVIIDDQISRTAKGDIDTLAGMHDLKESATAMKACLLRGDFEGFAKCLRDGWRAKKLTSRSISNPQIAELYSFVLARGGTAAKISGAGGGGFMMIVCDPVRRYELIAQLESRGDGYVVPVAFIEKGAEAWTLR